jgi:hypothetical protein
MNGNPIIEQFLAQQFGDNPQLQAMFSMMQQRQPDTSVESIDAEPVTHVPVAEMQAKLDKAHARIAYLKRNIAGLEAQLDDFETFEEDIAHALGACIYCWGEDSSCRACRGKGTPGTFEPDEERYKRWILPAVRRYQSLTSK